LAPNTHTLSLHDALPISEASTVGGVFGGRLTDGEAAFAAALEAIPDHARQAAALGGSRTVTVLPPRLDRPKDEMWSLVVERIKRSEEHTSELQSPDHLVC